MAKIGIIDNKYWAPPSFERPLQNVHSQADIPTPAAPRFTTRGRLSASGLGGEKMAYKKLLLDICHAGVVLDDISIFSHGLTGVLVDYTVEGTLTEIELFRARAV